MNGIIDIHCHLLPGVDDGAKTMDESIRSLKMAQEQGVSEIVLTPHFYPDSKQKGEDIIKAVARLQVEAAANNIDIKLHPGQECMYHADLVKRLQAGDALTMDGTHFVLVEFFPESSFNEIMDGLKKLNDAGYAPILAHYERYDCLRDIDRALEIRDQVALLQMNYSAIDIKQGLLGKHPYRKHLRSGVPDFLASDVHGPEWRCYNIKPVLEWLDEEIDDDYVEDLLWGNQQMIISTL